MVHALFLFLHFLFFTNFKKNKNVIFPMKTRGVYKCGSKVSRKKICDKSRSFCMVLAS